jgi:hypothetical protein
MRITGGPRARRPGHALLYSGTPDDGGDAASASDLALIISADSDLCPAIRTARSLNPGRGMIAAFPPR